jgi:tRNA pseudouridine13 synthase
MDDPDIHTSPRKKLKMHVEPHHQLPNVSSSTSTAPSADISGMANLDPRAQPSSDGLQFSKEAEVGILEFISPDLPGFSGILKQRYASDSHLVRIY